ncbi:MAG: protein-tyrosine phosphatase family protein [Pseudonocardia sp.]
MTDEQLVGAIELPDGTWIRGRGHRRPLPAGPLPDLGLYLGDPPGRPDSVLVRRRERWQPDWPADWIDWPDFRIPRNPELAAELISHAYLSARSGRRVEIACGGGTGRTGTVIACMAYLAGVPAQDALAWARRHYRRRAVETPGQRRWILWFAQRCSSAPT